MKAIRPFRGNVPRYVRRTLLGTRIEIDRAGALNGLRDVVANDSMFGDSRPFGAGFAAGRPLEWPS